MREKRLRWDERKGEMRLEEAVPPARTARRRWPVVVLMVAVVAAGGWYWLSRSPVNTPTVQTASEPGETAEPAREEPSQATEASDAPVLVGRVMEITDGDTIKVMLDSGPISVRFDAVDAPERDQPWGREATAALRQRLEGKEVVLEPVEQDRYERLVAVCISTMRA